MRVKIPEFWELKSYGRPETFVVVGCGGTGGYVVGPLARMIKVSGRRASLILVDGDDVEEKNLKRQHFIKRDLGKNKAHVMAGRYSAALGMEIQAVPDYMENASFLKTLKARMWKRSTVVIGCVDNNASRQVIHEWFMDGADGDPQLTGKFWIDSGNEEESGQVVCGYHPPRSVNLKEEKTSFSMPCVTEIYPSLLEGDLKFNSELSCAELAESAPQNMMANVTASTLILNFVQKILYNKPLASHGVSFSIDNSFRTMLNVDDALRKVTDSRRKDWETPPKKKRVRRKKKEA